MHPAQDGTGASSPFKGRHRSVSLASRWERVGWCLDVGLRQIQRLGLEATVWTGPD